MQPDFTTTHVNGISASTSQTEAAAALRPLHFHFYALDRLILKGYRDKLTPLYAVLWHWWSKFETLSLAVGVSPQRLRWVATVSTEVSFAS